METKCSRNDGTTEGQGESSIAPLLQSRTIIMTYEPPRGKTNRVVSEQVRHKPVCAVIETGLKLEISDLRMFAANEKVFKLFF